MFYSIITHLYRNKVIRPRSTLMFYDFSFTWCKLLDVWGKWVHTSPCDFPGTDPSVMLLRNICFLVQRAHEAPFMFCAHFNATRTPSKIAMALKLGHCRDWAFREHGAGIPLKQQCQTTERKLKVNKPHFQQQVAKSMELFLMAIKALLPPPIHSN